MASIRKFKKQISFLTEEVISNCNLAMYFQGNESFEPLTKVITKSVEQYNTLRDRAIHCPKDENTRKYYSQIKTDMINGADELFTEISTICQKKKK